MNFRKTTTEDLLEVLPIYQRAISFMRDTGNLHQWENFEDIKNKVIHDVQNGISYVGLSEKNEIQVVFSLIEEEPTYQVIDGKWIDETKYHTIHKIVSKGNRAGREALQYCLDEYGHIRIDTHADNKPMQHVLSELGFTYCGVIKLSDGSPRLAFEKNPSFTENLIGWYHQNRRILPWREEPTPYHVWLSEIMLQQTRVESVKAYYKRFLDAFPTVSSFAASEEDVYLKLWQGLGYYSRVRNLHKTAVLLHENYQDQLPDDYALLRKLPGIGDYTANAILAIAYQKKTVAVDGNLLRVYARVNALPVDVLDSKAKKDCYDFFLPLLGDRPGDFSQALMDLGEMTCLPNGTPLCDKCPLRLFCKAHQQGKETSYPLPKKKAEKKQIDKTIFVLKIENKYLIRKRPDTGLLASLYEPFNIDKKLKEDQIPEYLESGGFDVKSIKPLGKAKHIFTHLVWNMQGYEVELNSYHNEKALIPVTEQELESDYSIPTAFSYFLLPTKQ